jgi:hypothetical protein
VRLGHLAVLESSRRFGELTMYAIGNEERGGPSVSGVFGWRQGRPSTLLATALAIVFIAMPSGAAAQPAGSVEVSVTVAEPVEVCLLIDAGVLEAGLDFGVLELGDTATSTAYGLESCSTGTQELLAAGTDAANAAATVAWALVDGASGRATEQFSVDATMAGLGTSWLTADARTVGELGAGASASAAHRLVVAPAGSTGAGQTLTFELTWLAVLGE